MVTGRIKAAELIQRSWPAEAPFAYDRYLVRGRGGVVIPVDDDQVSSLHHVPGPGDLRGIVADLQGYVTANDVATGKVSLQPDAITEFEEYDPEKEVVFLFVEADGIATYRSAAPGQRSPKELYERSPYSKRAPHENK